jgi:hypothetical protein
MSIRESLQQIHDEADHIIGYEDDNKREVAILNSRVIKRLAKQALKELDKKVTHVKKWIRSGELHTSSTTIKGVIEECGRALDRNCATDILGDVVFLGNDRKYYTITVEAVIQEANMEYVKDLISENSHNQ